MNSAPDFHLDNRVILVTGATGHLGKAISWAVANMGGIPVLCARSQDKLEKLADEIRGEGNIAHTACFDIVQEDACRSMIQHLEKQSGRLDGIVNCAHSGKPATIETSAYNDFELAQKIHMNAPFFLIKEGLELLKKSAKHMSGGAAVVNIASMYGLVSPNPEIYGSSGSNNPPYYGAAKAGMIQLTRYLACHLGKYNIRVNSVSPGPFPPETIQQTSPDFYEKLCSKNPLGRIGLPSEVVGPVIFLLSAASSYITGANLIVDGGWTSW